MTLWEQANQVSSGIQVLFRGATPSGEEPDPDWPFWNQVRGEVVKFVAQHCSHDDVSHPNR